jgi:hypothetical protein
MDAQISWQYLDAIGGIPRNVTIKCDLTQDRQGNNDFGAAFFRKDERRTCFDTGPKSHAGADENLIIYSFSGHMKDHVIGRLFWS